MSTTITISYDDGGLLVRNKQQAAANRHAYEVNRAAKEAAQNGVEGLRARRIAEGRDPLTGGRLQTPRSSSRLVRTDQEPAANRRVSTLGSFYVAQRPVFEGETTYEEFKFISGDGQQSALVRLKLSTNYNANRPDDVQDTVVVTVGDPCNFVDPGYFESTETIIFYDIFNSTPQALQRSFMLPLSSKSCLYVFAYKTAVLPVLTTRTKVTLQRASGQGFDGFCIPDEVFFESVLVDTFTATAIEDKIETQYVCVLVGQNVCRVVDTPPSLANAIENSVQFGYDKLTSEYGPVLDMTVSYPYYELSTPPDYVPSIGLLYGGLGLSNQGAMPTITASPMSWFALDSFANSRAIETAQTYEDLLASSITVSSTRVTDLLATNEQLGLVSESSRLLRRSDGLYLSGPTSATNYPYTGTGWSQSSKKLAPSTTPATPSGFNAYQRHYIYTWDSQNFCSAQAQRYGISEAMT